jgi:hypothetical protein
MERFYSREEEVNTFGRSGVMQSEGKELCILKELVIRKGATRPVEEGLKWGYALGKRRHRYILKMCYEVRQGGYKIENGSYEVGKLNCTVGKCVMQLGKGVTQSRKKDLRSRKERSHAVGRKGLHNRKALHYIKEKDCIIERNAVMH